MTLPISGSFLPPYDLSFYLRMILLNSVWSNPSPDLTHLRMILLTSVWSYSPPCDLTHLRMILLNSVWPYPSPDLTHLRMILLTSVWSYSPPYDLTHLRILLTSIWPTKLRILLTSVWSYSPPYDLTHLCMTLLNYVVIMTLPNICLTWLTSIWQNSPMSRTSPSSPQFTQMLSLNMICAQQGKDKGTLHQDF